MPRVIWKGAISFGLVHVPVALYPASQEVGVDFDWLDKRSMDPVGYKRVNKRTGKEIAKEDIVKGIKLDDGDYVVLSDEEIKSAFPKSTQTIEIEAFVKASEIAFVLLERPYYLEPIGKGERVYALLRESMQDAGVIGIARVVMHNKEHLAALIPSGAALMLNTIRWATEMRSPDELKLPRPGQNVDQPETHRAQNGRPAHQRHDRAVEGRRLRGHIWCRCQKPGQAESGCWQNRAGHADGRLSRRCQRLQCGGPDGAAGKKPGAAQGTFGTGC